MIAAGHQPVYLPSLSFFALMKRADVFIHCSFLQFERRSWHHRNFIQGANGPLMLSVPISHAGATMAIRDAMYEGDGWKKEHLRKIYHAYGRSPFFDQYYPTIKSLLDDSDHHLSKLNISLTNQIAAWLGVQTVKTELLVSHGGDAIEKLIDLCDFVDADTYLSKPGADDYIGPEEEERLAEAGIKHTWLKWTDPEEEQPLSAIHYLFLLGPDARELI